MNLAMIGTGYVGLVSGACFAEVGHQVICMDNDLQKIAQLQRHQIPIYEPGLEDYVQRNIAAGRLSFTTDLAEAVRCSQVIFIAVGTPSRNDGSADLQYVYKVAREVGRLLDGYKIIVDKSTVPVGTGARVQQLIAAELARRQVEIPFDVVSNPEFLREGVAIRDFMEPDRIVIGVSSSRAEALMREVYRPWTDQGYPLYVMSVPSAEMTKYAANSFLAMKISFINEIANLCSLTGADINQVRLGIGSDRRIGSQFLAPGLGYGGSCFPKDVKALIHIGQEQGYDLRLLTATEVVNRGQRYRFLRRICDHFGGQLDGRRLAIWGLAFKPNTDDIREAPALTIIDKLLELGAELAVYDPAAMAEGQRYFREHPDRARLQFAASPEAALQGAEALIINTEWEVFGKYAPQQLKEALQAPVIFDGRNIFDPEIMQREGFIYYYIGGQNPRSA